MARIGIFGGSFNPPHLGHILALREFREKLALDTVVLIPAANPPHKTLTRNTPDAAHRLQMCKLAARDLPYVQVSDIELVRSGKSYTADTLRLLREKYPSDELFLLMGTDMFLSFESWYHPEEITAYAALAVAHRNEDDPEILQKYADKLEKKLHTNIYFVENSFLPHSSTSVRAMLAFHAAQTYLAPAVHDYIVKNGLYYYNDRMKELPFELLSEISLSLHDSKRVPHVIGCSDTAKRLALQYGVDPENARRAGILHDITKALNAEEQLKLCETYDIVLDNFERNHPKLLHAKTGAVIAERIFGENKLVCDAICWHTTGKANMSTLEKIIYIADYMEPNRCFDGVEKLRSLANSDLDDALFLGLQMTMEQLRQRKKDIGPNSMAAIRFLEERKKYE